VARETMLEWIDLMMVLPKNRLFLEYLQTEMFNEVFGVKKASHNNSKNDDGNLDIIG